MSKRPQAARPLLFGICCALFGCTVPPLESQFEGGPTVANIVDNINCELSSVLKTIKIEHDKNGNTLYDKNGLPKYNINPDAPNGWLVERIIADPQLGGLLANLTEAHFVASVLMTLDVLDTQGINPSLSFITPLYPGSALATSTNSTLAIGGSLSGTQERNITMSYSVDLESVGAKCATPVESTWRGLVGDLGLTQIIVDGLRGLDASSDVNVYGTSGPTALTVSDTITRLPLRFDRPGREAKEAGPNGVPPAVSAMPAVDGVLIFNGNMSFSPSTTDAKSPGTATFTGTAVSRDKNDRYFISLNGATLQEDPNRNVSFSLTGTMSRLSSGVLADALGFGPKLNLAGTIGSRYQPETLSLAGTAVPDVPSQNAQTPPVSVSSGRNQSRSQTALAGGAGQPSGGGGGGGTQAKSGGASSGGSTQFGSLINFIVSYGLNGGPNWTLRRFKGPSGGGGGGGSGGGSSGGGGGGSQFLNFTRTDTDTLSITFVAACKSAQNTQNPTTYWASLPHCDQYSRQNAASAGAANNLFLPFR